ncbi:hypothetical protein ACF08W_34635 [Streptomyces sp. NPDC015144]|uniref:hypothetical protein n=1 Tax=Streptomyces sp. NPDC015144 TaxID=3364944 RepID=UPI0036FE1229
MRALVTLPVLAVLAWAKPIGAFLVATGLLALAAMPGRAPIGPGLLVLVIAMLASAAVALAVALPYLPDTPAPRHTQ